MELGFETIGNATVICYDREPILATDPWITPQAYFGSWTLPYQIPEEQLNAIKNCKFIWFSHGHPDHLNPYSLPIFQKNKILIPDHFGNRIYHDLLAQNFDVTVLKNRQWTKLSERIKVLCISDYNQDAVLLIDIDGTLIVNSNDAGLTGWHTFSAKIIKRYKRTVRMASSSVGIGNADMFNFFDESGERIQILPEVADVELGQEIARHTDRLGIKFFIPFSSMHKHQREDSAWANRYLNNLGDYKRGYSSAKSEILSAFISYDLLKDTVENINPPETDGKIYPPEHFGDNWSDLLSKSDLEMSKKYFKSINRLSDTLDFINLRVGGKDNIIELSRKKFNRGITFEVPRHSLMMAVSGEIFDDLLIGNFMKTTLHGNWSSQRLYPDFTPYIAKFADNGRVKSEEEIRKYFSFYRNQAPFDYLKHKIEQGGINVILDTFGNDSTASKIAKKLYNIVK
jgi:hypothetical protein